MTVILPDKCPGCLRFHPYCGCTEWYTAFQIDCACTETSLEEAAMHVGPSFVYTLHIHPTQELYMIRLLRNMNAHLVDHPFAPHINLVRHTGHGTWEWWLEANGRGKGSKGC